ncbi:hypothetical protein BB559_002574 [Furculomyces boomerangus]|uniref:Uncharacterized protein n=1 Tax=Furculomyces boomerangus TaxID=61424 RepID=A0A2T9YUA1_9FUNG|nr:hypothetical protein BB559_002574 [Furculomyces boomerangus]
MMNCLFVITFCLISPATAQIDTMYSSNIAKYIVIPIIFILVITVVIYLSVRKKGTRVVAVQTPAPLNYPQTANVVYQIPVPEYQPISPIILNIPNQPEYQVPVNEPPPMYTPKN